MPLSVFDGEATQELHEHYDPDGNLTGTTVVTRPGWSDDDRAWALGLALHEAYRCPRGHDLTESTDPAWLWHAADPLVCLACVALDNAVDKYKDNPHRRAQLHSVKKVPRPQKKRRG